MDATERGQNSQDGAEAPMDPDDWWAEAIRDISPDRLAAFLADQRPLHALHEAAHAVIAVALGYEVIHVKMAPSDVMANTWAYTRLFQPRCIDNPAAFDLLEVADACVQSLAGPVVDVLGDAWTSEGVVDPDLEYDLDERLDCARIDDDQDVLRSLAWIAEALVLDEDDIEVGMAFSWIVERTQRLLREFRPAVVAVRDRLLVVDTLSGSEILALCEAACGGQQPSHLTQGFGLVAGDG